MRRQRGYIEALGNSLGHSCCKNKCSRRRKIKFVMGKNVKNNEKLGIILEVKRIKRRETEGLDIFRRRSLKIIQ